MQISSILFLGSFVRYFWAHRMHCCIFLQSANWSWTGFFVSSWSNRNSLLKYDRIPKFWDDNSTSPGRGRKKVSPGLIQMSDITLRTNTTFNAILEFLTAYEKTQFMTATYRKASSLSYLLSSRCFDCFLLWHQSKRILFIIIFLCITWTVLDTVCTLYPKNVLTFW